LGDFVFLIVVPKRKPLSSRKTRLSLSFQSTTRANTKTSHSSSSPTIYSLPVIVSLTEMTSLWPQPRPVPTRHHRIHVPRFSNVALPLYIELLSIDIIRETVIPAFARLSELRRLRRLFRHPFLRNFLIPLFVELCVSCSAGTYLSNHGRTAYMSNP
jgi:hypothetical protein